MGLKISTMRADTELLWTCTDLLNNFENVKLIKTNEDKLHIKMLEKYKIMRRIAGKELYDKLKREYQLVTDSSVIPIILPREYMEIMEMKERISKSIIENEEME